MCNVGDIILVESYQHQGDQISRHSFVVLSVESGEIKGLPYDFVCNVLSSFKNEQHRAKKLEYPGNFEITHKDSDIVDANKKDGYIKSEQFYYFNNTKTDYSIIGELHPKVFNKLIEYIENLQVPIEYIIDNL